MHEQSAVDGEGGRSGELALVGRCLAGDAAAQDELVRRHAGLVWSLCMRAGLGHAEAEDVSQEIFWHAFQALPRFRGDSRLSTWLATLAFRRIVDHRRSPARREVAAGAASEAGFPQPPQAGLPRPGSAVAEESSPETDAGRAQRGRRVRATLDGLAEPARSVLVAYYLGELPVLEIARTLEMPVGTVKTHLHRGRRVLRDRLRDLC
jgi:RNA polymerase sigma-70 factor (ECF subfamily)